MSPRRVQVRMAATALTGALCGSAFDCGHTLTGVLLAVWIVVLIVTESRP